jgi:hypothetical protein
MSEATTGQRAKYFFFLDNVKHESETSTISGAVVRSKLPPEKSGYAVYLDAPGNEPDPLVKDTDNFSLEKTPLHFYSVPPANFGKE